MTEDEVAISPAAASAILALIVIALSLPAVMFALLYGVGLLDLRRFGRSQTLIDASMIISVGGVYSILIMPFGIVVAWFARRHLRTTVGRISIAMVAIGAVVWVLALLH